VFKKLVVQMEESLSGHRTHLVSGALSASETTPTKTPEGLEAEIIQLRQTLSPDGAETVSARVIQDHLSHHPIASILRFARSITFPNMPQKGSQSS